MKKVYGIIAIALMLFSCQKEEMKDFKEIKTSQQIFSKSIEETDALDVVISQIDENYYSDSKAIINCIVITHGMNGQPTHAHACVDVNGAMYEVTYWTGYYSNGNYYEPLGHAAPRKNCGC